MEALIWLVVIILIIWAVIMAVAGVIGLMIKYWMIVLFVVVFCVFIYFTHKTNKKNEEVRREEEKEQQRREILKAEKEEEERKNIENQKALLVKKREELNALLAASVELVSRASGLVQSAEHHLDKAEEEFSEGAFVLFWDEIEYANKKLAEHKKTIDIIDANSTRYKIESSTLDVPSFSLPNMPDAQSTATRLDVIVRKAHKNHQFASIFEQRKATAALHAGPVIISNQPQDNHFRDEKFPDVCDRCFGERQIFCPKDCISGKIECPHPGCLNGYLNWEKRIMCPTCHGERMIECNVCHGMGMLDCPRCGGSGTER